MDEATKRITDGLMKAIRTEADGYHFYTMAAEKTQDEKGREVFQTLAQEELAHMRFLEAQYQSFSKSGKASYTIRLVLCA